MEWWDGAQWESKAAAIAEEKIQRMVEEKRQNDVGTHSKEEERPGWEPCMNWTPLKVYYNWVFWKVIFNGSNWIVDHYGIFLLKLMKYISILCLIDWCFEFWWWNCCWVLRLKNKIGGKSAWLLNFRVNL